MENPPGDKKIGIALGAGGANGLAHILVLEIFDELGIRPCHIAASSIGAVIGALYASGIPAREIREMSDELVVRKTDKWKHVLLDKKIFEWIHFLDPVFGQGGFLKTDAFLSWLMESIRGDSFEELEIPLSVVATDFWAAKQKVFDSGELRPAIQSSIALPGLFTPSKVDGQVLVDGGAVNPVPYDILPRDCDITVAIDIVGKRTEKSDLSFMDTVFNTLEIMQRSIMAEKLKAGAPDLYYGLEITDIRSLEFFKLDEIFEQAEPAKKEIRERLLALLDQ